MSTTGSTPLFEVTNKMSPVKKTTVYSTAASMGMRTIGIRVLFVLRTSKTSRSTIQMRYASSPGHGQGFDAALKEMRSPELNALVAIVEAKNAVTHYVISPT
jgi:hypothetical protein